jgi:hypothetical protein
MPALTSALATAARADGDLVIAIVDALERIAVLASLMALVEY